MKQSNPLLKGAVVLSSVLLVCGLIAYRAGAFDWFNETNPTTMGGSKMRQVIELRASDASDQPSPDAAQPTTIIMSGSKSLPGLVPPTPTTPPQSAQPPPASQKQSPTIMQGSKTGVLTIPRSSGF